MVPVGGIISCLVWIEFPSRTLDEPTVPATSGARTHGEAAALHV